MKPKKTNLRICLIAAATLSLTLSAFAADPVTMVPPPAPAPTPGPGPMMTTTAKENGVWGAIATAPQSGRYGIFWGGATRAEAEASALRHCADLGGRNCAIGTVFRSRGPFDRIDGTGFPYHRCGALAVPKVAGTGRWSSVSADSARQAGKTALAGCGGSDLCRVEETVCT